MRRLSAFFLLTAAAAFAFPNPDGGCSITSPGVLTQAVLNADISYTIATSGCATLRKASVVTGALPPGLSLTTNATSVTISGTPTATGTYAFGLRVIDGLLKLPSKSFVIKVNGPVQIDTPALASGVANAAYSDQLLVRGGVGPYSFSVVEGSLPSGLTLNSSTGAISGTMPATGTRFRIRATDSSSPANTAEKSYVIGVGGSLNAATLPVGSAGVSYTATITGSLGASGFSVVLGNLPGLTISSSGVLTGTPEAPGEYHFTIRQTSGNTSAWRSYRIFVNNAATILGTPRSAEETFAYDHVFSVSGGVAPFTFSLAGGSLPTGITLDSGTGALLGELALGASGTSFTIGATDASGRSYSQAFSIASVLKLALPTTGPQANITPTVPAVKVYEYVSGLANPYTVLNGGPSQTLEQIGGTGRNQIYYNPTDNTLNYSFAGTGTYRPFYITTDTLGGALPMPIINFNCYGDIRFNENTEFPNGVAGANYSALPTLRNTNFTPLSFALSSGSLPSGLSLNSTTGEISGIPASGFAQFGITVTDAKGQQDTRSFSIGIGTSLVITTSSLPNGTVNVAYPSTTISVSGALSSFATSGTLPPGLTLSSGGVLSGTPTTPGIYSFFVTASGVSGVTVGPTNSKGYTVIISNPLSSTVSPVSPAELTEGQDNQVFVNINGGRWPMTFSLTSGTLPEGLYLNDYIESPGISGYGEVAGSATLAILVTDADGRTTTISSYDVNVRKQVVMLTRKLATATRNAVYSQTFTASGGRAPYNWSVYTGTLPTGLTLSSGGVLSGTPTTNGTYNFSIMVSDADGRGYVSVANFNPVLSSAKGQRAAAVTPRGALSAFTMEVADPIAFSNSVPLPNGILLNSYSAQMAITGGNGSTNFTISSGNLPPLIDLGSSGAIGTWPLAPGVYNFTVRAEDSAGRFATQAQQITIGGGVFLTPATLPDGLPNVSYSQQLTAVNAVGFTAWFVSSGNLPNGLNLDSSTGLISGTPTTVGTFNFSVQVADSLQQGTTQAFTIVIGNPLSITTSTLADATVQEVYSAQLVASIANGISWQLQSGSLPPGLTLSSGGVIGGTPTTGGTYTFTVLAFSGSPTSGITATKQLSLTVVPLLVINTGSLGEAIQGRAYTNTLSASGGRTPYTWSNSTPLPAGLTLNSTTGIISGSTLVAEGTYTVTVTVTDSRSRTATRTLPLVVNQPPAPPLVLSPDTLPNGRVGEPYSAGFSASGGRPGYTFSVLGGGLPPGVTFTGSSLTGTPTTAGTYRFTVNVTDAAGTVTGNLYSVTIDAALLPLAVSPASIPATSTVGSTFSVLFGGTGGKAPYTLVFSGTAPAGTSFSNGLLDGTLTTAGTYNFSVEVTDALRNKASKSYSLTVTALTITTQPPLASGVVGTPYSVGFGASGGRQPYTWSISGSTPPGLGFDANTGELSGTPTEAGTFSFSVQVRDAVRQSAQASFSITINDRLEITNAPGDNPLFVGQSFSFAFTTRGGRAPITFSVLDGQLPPGISLSGNGSLSGSPTTPGSFSFSVLAVDSLGNRATRGASLRVLAALTVTTASLPNGTVGADYSAGVSASGGLAPLGVWTISGGSLPAGLSLAADGSISGKPTAAGSSSFTVRITDAAGNAATRGLSITVGLPPVPPVNLVGLPTTLPPGTQTNITIRLAQPFPVPVTGTLTLIFEPNAVNNADDPAVQFSNGSRSITFTIPAGQTDGTFPVNPLRLLSGTVAGNIRIRTATVPESATPVPDAVLPLGRAVPVITAGTAQLGTGTFTLLVDGFSNTREISSATFRLTPVAGAPLQTTDVQVAVAAAYTAWYQSTASIPFGGQFRLTMPFNVAGSLADIDSVTVTVTNTVGASQPFTIRLR